MWESKLVVCLACVASAGCMETIGETRSLPPVQEVVLLPPAPHGGGALRAFFERDADFIGGRLEWAATCRRALLVHPRSETVTRSVPSTEHALAAGMGAVGTGSAGALLLANRNDFSDEKTCSVDSQGTEACSSPRGSATVGGALLVSTGIALATASIVTLASRPSTNSVEVTREPDLPPRILESNVPCGEGPIAGLRLGVYLGDERIAVVSTDEQGEVGFTVPAWAGDALTLKAEHVPLGIRMITRGQTLGTVRPVERSPGSPL